MDEGIRREELAVHVRRSHVFEDSFRELHRRSADEWKNRFYIVFEGNECTSYYKSFPYAPSFIVFQWFFSPVFIMKL
jgi:hypothetical protein